MEEAGALQAGVLESVPKGPLLRSNGPLYRQIVQRFEHAIRTGELPVGLSLPKERDIAAHFGVSLITVRAALSDLAGAGLLDKRSGKPAVVIAERPSSGGSLRLKNFSDIAAFTLDARLVVSSYGPEASAPAEAFFGLEPGASIPCLRGLLIRNRVPISRISSYFHPSFADRLARTDFDEVLIFRTVQKRLARRLVGARVHVRAELADETLAADIDYTAGGPILAVEMQYRTEDNEPVEVTFGQYRADLVSLTYDVVNDQP